MKARSKQLWLLAGGNGVGKSTFYRVQLKPLGLPFVNADVIARELHPDAPELFSYEASRIAESMRSELLVEGKSFCFETVFSHKSKIDFVASAKAFGYEIVLVFIHLNQISLNKARVAQRVIEGGHSVPDDKIESRIPKLLENIKVTLPLCDHVRLLDNSSIDNPFKQVAMVRNGDITELEIPLPDWAHKLMYTS